MTTETGGISITVVQDAGISFSCLELEITEGLLMEHATTVEGVGRSADSHAIVAAVIAMSHALGKNVIAEGVETGEQLALLGQLGCDEIQGHHVSPALPAPQFAAFARARAANPDATAAL
jgi:EAL domain-containing protein (putative c-di-GMP-specific phosphodiesterase class I)